jgi:Sigma-70, region 4
MSKEEEAILWRSVERIPEIYREPLVLFYREHQSIEKVAQALGLNEDAVKQWLSRGRKLLHEQALAFVANALERTNPGKAFTVGVLAALPVLSVSASAATAGAAAAKGSATAKAAAATGLLGAILAPVLALFGTWVDYRMSLDSSQSDRERESIRSFYRKLAGCICGFFIAYALLMVSARDLLFAFGGVALAPVSIGGLAIGLIPFGGCAAGFLALGGFAFGVWSFGGLALGWQSFAGCAVAWNAAVGGAAIAHDFALGGLAAAAEANNELAAAFVRRSLFFQKAQAVFPYLA